MFSVVVPAYNASLYLEETLQSVAAQTLGDWECIVVDDGSTDDTYEIAKRFAQRDQRFRALRKPNGGCGSARNAALAEARSSLISLLDSDDLYLPSYLETQARFIAEHPGFDLYSCNGLVLYPDGSTKPYFDDPVHAEITSFVLDDFFENCPILGIAIYRREMAARINDYRTDLRNAEDYDFWVRAMASRAKQIHNPETLVVYRKSLTSKSSNRVKAAKAVARILHDLSADKTLTAEERAHLARVIARRDEAIGRREMEQRFLGGDFRDGRAAFWATRHGYAARAKYTVALMLTMVSPRLYTRLVLRRSS
jgi:glycosyltransferase involved in cell wall biosynthesis